MNRQELGKYGEEQAVKYLTRLGFFVIALNYRTRQGEIEVIATDHNAIHFVEVKTRRSLTHGYPIEAVNRKKQSHIKQAARFFLQDMGQSIFRDYDVSFDVIEVYMQGPKEHSIRFTPQCF